MDEGGAVHHAGIGVREQAGFFQDEFAHGGEIVERARVALTAEEFAGFGEYLFRLVAQAEECFLAAGLTAAFGEGEDFLAGHEMSAGLARVFAEGAVAAIVAAEGRQRDEDFFRKGDDGSLALGTQFSGGAYEVREGSLRGQQKGFFAREGMECVEHLRGTYGYIGNLTQRAQRTQRTQRRENQRNRSSLAGRMMRVAGSVEGL